jgi:hypothetical protein
MEKAIRHKGIKACRHKERNKVPFQVCRLPIDRRFTIADSSAAADRLPSAVSRLPSAVSRFTKNPGNNLPGPA